MINIVRDALESIVSVNRAKVLAGARKAALVGVALIMFMMTVIWQLHNHTAFLC